MQNYLPYAEKTYYILQVSINVSWFCLLHFIVAVSVNELKMIQNKHWKDWLSCCVISYD